MELHLVFLHEIMKDLYGLQQEYMKYYELREYYNYFNMKYCFTKIK